MQLSQKVSFIVGINKNFKLKFIRVDNKHLMDLAPGWYTVSEGQIGVRYEVKIFGKECGAIEFYNGTQEKWFCKLDAPSRVNVELTALKRINGRWVWFRKNFSVSDLL